MFAKLFGDPNRRVIKLLQPIIDQINSLEGSVRASSDEELRGKTAEFRRLLAEGRALDDLLPDAFAVCREAAHRTLGQRHYDVQLVGGLVLHRGEIAEMRTGEGKTLTATLAVYANALLGKGVHLVTVNDYLARRDAVWMGQVYHALGMSVGIIQHDTAYRYDPGHEGTPEDKERDTTGAFKIQYAFLRPVARKEAYACDITYGTNNEYGFDYLRDNMVATPDEMVQRELSYAIVDEVDSILIDEARTPLIISAPAEESTDLYYHFADVVRRLDATVDYTVDEKMHAATVTDVGHSKIVSLIGQDPWATSDIRTVHHLEQALKAETLYKRDRNYVVKDGEVVIVDEFTGRLMMGRRYSEGLHQAIEGKEGVKIQRESQTMATVTFQNYFRLYKKLAGMTGTAATEAEEFSKIYKLDVVSIPTAKPMVRQDQADRVYSSETGKFKAVVEEIKMRHEKGQPVLVGTVSIEKNERLSEMLTRAGVPHNILNAKNHEKEAEFIAQAGRKGAVTVATNMAGRGVDIIMGGNPPVPAEADEVRRLGGLHVLGTERHESRRIDNQLRGRSGRQGDPGSSQFYLSLEDDLMRIFASDRVKAIMKRLGMPEDMPIENKMVSSSIASAQKKVEGHNFDIRKHLLEYDDVLNKHREAIYRKRRETLHATDAKEIVLSMVEEELKTIVSMHASGERGGEWNAEEIVRIAGAIFPTPPGLAAEFVKLRENEGDRLKAAEIRTRIIERLMQIARDEYAGVETRIGNADIMRQIERAILLRAMDLYWVEHLDAMDHLRTGIGLRGYGQQDPLVEYKREAFRMFRELQSVIQKQVVYSIFKVGIAAQTAARHVHAPRNLHLSAPSKEGDAGGQMSGASGSGVPKTGRNELCPCGSGKKFKKCHGT